MILVVATHNAGKLREYRALLGDLGVELRSLADVRRRAGGRRGRRHLPRQRPRQGARAGRALPACRRWPTTRASRSTRSAARPACARRASPPTPAAAPPGDDQANLALLLERLRGVPDARRDARFRCVIVVARPDGRELVAEGTCEGAHHHARRAAAAASATIRSSSIRRSARTFAELAAAEKDRVSHRARAVAAAAPRCCRRSLP